jgi:hypothetical protein
MVLFGPQRKFRWYGMGPILKVFFFGLRPGTQAAGLLGRRLRDYWDAGCGTTGTQATGLLIDQGNTEGRMSKDLFLIHCDPLL